MAGNSGTQAKGIDMTDSNAAFRFNHKMNFDFQAAWSEDVQLMTSLATIEEAELVRRLAEQDAAYLFKHALVQDTAYTSLLKQERRRLHRMIGGTLETLYDARTDEFVNELARHFSEAGDSEKSFLYANLAGDAAARVFAYTEAFEYYKNALTALAQLPTTDNVRRRYADVVVKLVSVSLRSQGPEASLALLRNAEEKLQKVEFEPQDRERLARVHFWMGDAYSHLNQQREAIAYLQQVLDVAKQGITDEALLAIPSNVIGRALVAQGKFSEAEPLLARAAPMLEKSANWYEWVLAVGFLGFARAAQGDTAGGLRETNRAFTRAQELRTPIGVGDSRIFTSFIQMQRGDYAQMLADANLALEAAQGHHDQLLIYLGHNVRAWAQTRLGNFQAANENFAQAHALAAQMGGQLFFADMFQAAYAELALAEGQPEEALKRAASAVEVARQVGSVFSEGLAQRIWGEALSALGLPDAAHHFEMSIQLLESGSAHIEAARTRTAAQTQ